MEARFTKVLESSDGVEHHRKRKRTAKLGAYLSCPSCSNAQHGSKLSCSTLEKRRGLDGGKKISIYGNHSGKSLVRYYCSYKKTTVPKRVMFFKSGEWMDFPEDLLSTIKKDLDEKKAAIEVDWDGRQCVLDFLHMYQLDLETGLKTPLAWIDVEGKCFFPEIFHDDKERIDKLAEDPEAYRSTHDIKLHLEVDVNGSDQTRLNLKEDSGESSGDNEQKQITEKLANEQYTAEAQFSSNNAAAETRDRAKTEVIDWFHSTDEVRSIFLSGVASLGDVHVLDVYGCSNELAQTRLELFQKQVEITEKHRGDANVRYAWLCTKKESLSSIMMHGLGQGGKFIKKSIYGMGIHLTAVNRPNASARFCDVDENGVRHMVLCRVIMGNMEPLRGGRMQFFSGGEEYDNGVNDLENPKDYIVWSANVNTHIHPECVVSFKLSTNAEGNLAGMQRNLDNSGVASERPNGMLPLCQGSNPTTGSPGRAFSVGSNSQKPRSPWMSFPKLFAAISDKVPRKVMLILDAEYKLLMERKTKRMDFVKNIRLLVGDALLRSTLTGTHDPLLNQDLVKPELKPKRSGGR